MLGRLLAVSVPVPVSVPIALAAGDDDSTRCRVATILAEVDWGLTSIQGSEQETVSGRQSNRNR